MRHLDGLYTVRFNRAHRYEGPLFGGHYKAILVMEKDRALRGRVEQMRSELMKRQA